MSKIQVKFKIDYEVEIDLSEEYITKEEFLKLHLFKQERILKAWSDEWKSGAGIYDVKVEEREDDNI